MSGQTHTERRLRSELPDDIDFESSPNEVRNLLESVAWHDVRRFLDDHILWCYQQLESVETLEELTSYQGQIKMAKTILGLPDHILEQLELEKENG